MQLVNPAFLWAFLALAIPVVIHLFNFRRFRKVFFSNVAFLKTVELTTQKSARLRNRLVLFLRLLALSFLILAFAQPFWKSSSTRVQAGRQAISVYLDNSYSMGMDGGAGVLFEQARKAAQELAMAYRPSDRFQLLTNDLEGKHQRLVNREEFLQMVREVKPSPASPPLSRIWQRQRDALRTAGIGQGQAFWLSDFQKGQCDAERLAALRDTSLRVTLVPLEGRGQPNVFIDSVWFSDPLHQPEQLERLMVRVACTAPEDRQVENVPVKLTINGLQKAVATTNLSSGQKVVLTLSYRNPGPGPVSGVVQVQDHPLFFDDPFYFQYTVRGRMQVMAINDGSAPNFINSVFSNDSSVQFRSTPINQVDPEVLEQQDLLVFSGVNALSTGLAQVLEQAVKQGTSCFIFPGSEADGTSFNALLATWGLPLLGALDTTDMPTANLQTQHPLYKGVFELERMRRQTLDLPLVKGHFRLMNHSTQAFETLLSLEDRSPFLTLRRRGGQGTVFLCASPLDEIHSNFPKHALFVITLFQAALQSGKSTPPFYTLQGGENVLLPGIRTKGDQTLQMSPAAHPESNFIPRQKVLSEGTLLQLSGEPSEPGWYNVRLGSDVVSVLAFNLSRNESVMEFESPSDLAGRLEQAGWPKVETIQPKGRSTQALVLEAREGIRLWKWCVGLALLALLIEILVLRGIPFGNLLSFKSKAHDVSS